MRTLKNLIADQRMKVALALAGGVALLAIWLAIVDERQVLHRLAQLDVRWLAGFTVLWVAAAFLRSLRWRAILSRVAPVRPAETFAGFMACMLVNFLIPLRVGEVVAGLALKRRRNIPFAQSLPSQALDRLFDLTPVVPALLLVFALQGEAVTRLRVILGFVGVVFGALSAVVVVTMIHPEWAAALARRFFGLLPVRMRGRAEDFVVHCLKGLSGLRLPVSTIAILIVVTFLALAMDSVALGMIFRGLGYEITPAVVLTGYTLIFLSSALPRPPGQVGSLELLFVLVFSGLLGVDRDLAGAAVLVGHSMIAIILAVTGSLSLFSLGIHSVSIVREHLPSASANEAS
jgi:uncharacterized protein (TIRG00374 family)